MDLKEVKTEMPLSEQVKMAAESELKKETIEKAKNALLDLYRKREKARELVANVDREIVDYEMKLDGK